MQVEGRDWQGKVVWRGKIEDAVGMSWGVREDFEKGTRTVATNWCMNNPMNVSLWAVMPEANEENL